MSQVSQNLFGILCGGFFIFVFFAGGVAALIFGIRNRKKATESVNWPRVSGTITNTQIRRETDTDEEGFTSISYVPEIEYQYQIGGEVYTGKRISYGSTRSYNTSQKAEEAISQYPLNGQVTVYYNPQKPEESVLIQGTKGTLTLIILGVVFILISICATCIGSYLLLFNQ